MPAEHLLVSIAPKLVAPLARMTWTAWVLRLPRITIDTPKQGETVSHRRMVRGTVSRLDELQIYIGAPNGVWYRQPGPTYDGGTWSSNCYFGNPESVNSHYKIVALEGRAWLANQTRELPRGMIRSKTVTVLRGT